jgi:hypothetical protein
MKSAHVLVVVLALLVSMLLAIVASIRVPVSVNRFEIDTPTPAHQETPVSVGEGRSPPA